MGAYDAIDISDGLASDVRRLAEACGYGMEIDILPIADEVARVADARGWDADAIVLGGGEDFELLVALPDEDVGDLIRIGAVIDEGLFVVRHGEREVLDATGFDHFSQT